MLPIGLYPDNRNEDFNSLPVSGFIISKGHLQYQAPMLIANKNYNKEKNFMDKNYKIAEAVLENIGGRENVKDVVHCATRLRFHLYDESKVNEENLKNTDGIFGVMNATGMYQVIVGQNVEKVYDHLCAMGDFTKEKAVDEVLDKDMTDDGKKIDIKKIGNNILSYVAASIAPLVPLLLGAGLWNVIGMIFGPTMLNVISTESGFYLTTQMIYNSFFYFLPVFVGYSAAKALKTNEMWGILIGCIIIVPDFVNMVGTVDSFSLFSIINVPVASYSQTFLPVLIGVWIFSYAYKVIKKYMPSVLFSTFAPIIIYGFVAIIMFTICAPLGTYVGNAITSVFMWMASSILPIRILAYALLTSLWPLITLCGFHLPISMVAIGLLAENGTDTFVLVCALTSVYFVYGMALGAFFKFKKPENKSTAISAFISGYIGAILEPTLYGVCLKSKSAMTVMISGGAIVGILLSIFKPVYYNVGVGNVFALFGVYAGGSVTNIVIGVGLALFATVLGAIGTILFVKFDE